MNHTIALFADLNQFSVKRELLFRYLKTLNDEVYYLVLSNKRLGRISKYYSFPSKLGIVSMGYKDNIDRRFVKKHLEEIRYFLSSYNVEKIVIADSELDILNRYFLIQKVDETYYRDIVEYDDKKVPYCDKSLVFDFAYRNEISNEEIKIVKAIINENEYKVNIFVRKDDKKKFDEVFEKKAKLLVKKDYIQPYSSNFDFGIVFNKIDVLSYLDFSREGIRTFSFDSFFDKALHLTKGKYLSQIKNVFSDKNQTMKIKYELKNIDL